VVAQWLEAWWLNDGGVVAQFEVWWLNGSMPDCCPAVLGSNLVSPQPQLTANLLVGCHLGWHLAVS
jgi:hypothetical protein